MVRGGGAELFLDLVVLQMDAFDLVIETASFNSGPINDGRGRRDRVAQVGLLIDFFEAGAGAAIDQELFRGDAGAALAVDDVQQAEFESVGHGDAVI